MGHRNNINSIIFTKAQDRLIRLRDAACYVGMDKNRFNKLVRPNLTQIPIGIQGIAFDRLELDSWVDYYIDCVGRPGNQLQEKKICLKKHRDLPKGTTSGTLTKSSKEKEFMKALEQATLKKPNDI